VTITRSLADELATRFGRRDRVFVIPDGARAVHDVPVVPNVPAPVAGYAGHLYPWKGVDVFLHALSLVPEVRGLVIGGHPADGDLSRIRGLVDTLGLAHRVELVGQVPPGDVRRTLAAATMLVLPNTPSAISERYTSPLKLFEYLGMGRPIVASDLPSLREVLTHEGDALLVTAGDPAAMAGALRRLASDAALAARLASGAARLVPQYTWERRAERLDAAFAAALARPA
jgi:glycosyltransferase involved in cell wall biosynthesis